MTTKQSVISKEEQALNSSVLGKFRQWNHEATRVADGAELFTSVVYNHATRGTWDAVLRVNGKFERLARLPRVLVSSKSWNLTDYGFELRQEGRI